MAGTRFHGDAETRRRANFFGSAVKRRGGQNNLLYSKRLYIRYGKHNAPQHITLITSDNWGHQSRHALN
jgi:hypothetical protein